MSEFIDYLSLCFTVYNTQSMLGVSENQKNTLNRVLYDYTPITINNYTDNNGFYIRENFACAAYKNGNKIIISFRGTDDNVDKYVSDLDIYLGNVPRVSYLYAEEFYLKLKSLYQDAEIEFTGHSLGGAIAQLMGAKYGNKTVTFNAPG